MKRHHNNYWTFERCLAACKKYNNGTDLRKKHSVLYQTICRNGWRVQIYELLEYGKDDSKK